MMKDEFILRYAQIAGPKLRQFKRVLMPWFRAMKQSMVLPEKELLSALQLSDEQQQQFKQAEVSHTLKWLEHSDHHLMIYADPDYPELLRQINSAPLLLFVKGDKQSLKTPQIAMVGSRHFSRYGAHWARYFSAQLALNGLTITSGLALGIDAISHQGALDVHGKTVAVLGSGLNQISPRSNLFLAKEILEHGGALVSEFFPHEEARAEFFPRRNRIISGLSLGTFIVEATERSGSLITARYAIEQNRDLFALPGDISNELLSGTHNLIKQGAYLVTHPEDILTHYAASLNWLKSQSTDDQGVAQVIHPDIFAIITKEPQAPDRIAEKLGQSITDVSIKLVELELEGLITVVSGGYIRAYPG